MRQFILLPTFEKGLWSSIYLQLEASCDVYKKYWDFYLSNVSFTCIFGFRLQKLLKSLNFLLLLMECMDTLLLVVTHLFQWDLLAIVPVLTLGTLSKRWMVPWLACEKWSLWALACLEIPRLTPLLLICVCIGIAFLQYCCYMQVALMCPSQTGYFLLWQSIKMFHFLSRKQSCNQIFYMAGIICLFCSLCQ